MSNYKRLMVFTGQQKIEGLNQITYFNQLTLPQMQLSHWIKKKCPQDFSLLYCQNWPYLLSSNSSREAMVNWSFDLPNLHCTVFMLFWQVLLNSIKKVVCHDFCTLRQGIYCHELLSHMYEAPLVPFHPTYYALHPLCLVGESSRHNFAPRASWANLRSSFALLTFVG